MWDYLRDWESVEIYMWRPRVVREGGEKPSLAWDPKLWGKDARWAVKYFSPYLSFFPSSSRVAFTFPLSLSVQVPPSPSRAEPDTSPFSSSESPSRGVRKRVFSPGRPREWQAAHLTVVILISRGSVIDQTGLRWIGIPRWVKFRPSYLVSRSLMSPRLSSAPTLRTIHFKGEN